MVTSSSVHFQDAENAGQTTYLQGLADPGTDPPAWRHPLHLDHLGCPAKVREPFPDGVLFKIPPPPTKNNFEGYMVQSD